MIELNLIPDVKQELIRARRQQAIVISTSIILAIAAGGVVAALALYVFGAQEILKNNANSETTKQMTELKSVKDLEKTLTVQQQVASIGSQQDDKLISSRLLDVLNAIVPNDKNKVSLTMVSLDAETKTILLEGGAENGYEALEIFKKRIADTKFSYLLEGDKKRTVASVATAIDDNDRSYGESSTGQRLLRFKIVLSYQDELFMSTSKSLNIDPPLSGNVTDSSSGVPKSLFSDKTATGPGGNE